MNYRINPKNGDKISALAFGFMRVGRDEKEVAKYLLSASKSGVNYIDTAYIYPSNETLLGRVLPKEYREKVRLATKLPPYLVRKTEDLDKIFSTELARLQTDYIDYYLIHMLVNKGEWERLIKLGILEWIKAKKESGKIRNIGFSYHGSFDGFKELFDAYGWEFCMLQYNYLDENNQAGRKGVEYAAGKGVPVMIMEPLRGGTLANKLPHGAIAEFKASNPDITPAEWALRWLWNQPSVLTVLSGMTSLKMVEENAAAASKMEAGALSPSELEVYGRVRKIILDNMSVGCTGCGYCMPCPQGVDIPLCFDCYNNLKLENAIQGKFHYILRASGHEASLCTKCGKCEKHCPQGVQIRDELAKTTKAMGGFPFAPGRKLIRRFMGLSKKA